MADETQIDLSAKAERAVARTFMGRIQWEMILILECYLERYTLKLTITQSEVQA
mgnify:CR=1 FL=1